jgi:hypothetical protein
VLQGGWLSQTKTFLGGIAKEVGSLVTPIPEQSGNPKSSNVSSPIGNSYNPAGAQGYPGYGNIGGQQQQQQQGQNPPMPQGGDYMSQFDQTLNRELQQNAQGGGYRYAGGGGAAPSPSHGGQQTNGYGHLDSSWNEPGSDGILPVVPLAQQYGAAPSSRGGSRRSSLDGGAGNAGAPGQQPQLSVNPALPSAATTAFPTSAFPKTPPSALSQQLQPLGHANYVPSRSPGGATQANTFDSTAGFQGVTAISGSPSPPPPPQPQIFTGAPYNPLVPANPNSNFNSPMNATQPAGFSGSSFNSSMNAVSSQPSAPSSLGPSLAPPVFPAGALNTAPPARRVLDESSMNPSPLGAQQNPQFGAQQGFGQSQFGGAPSYATPGQPAIPLPVANPPAPLVPPGSGGGGSYGAHTNLLASPGRVLSPAFNTDASGPGTGAPMVRPPQPGLPPAIGSAQSTYGMQPPQTQQMPGYGAPGSAPQQQPPSAAPGAAGAPYGFAPPAPPPSNYWKQRAAVAPPEAPIKHVARVDYSDLDYKSMDFGYNNRYEQSNFGYDQAPLSGHNPLPSPGQQYPAMPPSQPTQQQQPQFQQQQQQQQQAPPPFGQPPQSFAQPAGVPSYGAPQGYSGYGR